MSDMVRTARSVMMLHRRADAEDIVDMVVVVVVDPSHRPPLSTTAAWRHHDSRDANIQKTSNSVEPRPC